MALMVLTKKWTLAPAALLLLWGCTYTLRSQETAPAAQSTDTPPPASDGARPGPPHGGPEHRLAMLQHELSLSAEQAAQVKTILANERTQMEALRSGESTTPEERHAQMEAIRKTSDTAIRGLLTADQAAKFDAMEARMRAHRPDHDGPPPAPDGSATPGDH